MCDTFVATPATTTGKIMVFAKNSDREPGEAQAVELVAEAEHPPGARVHCTHIAIAQAARTRRALLCRPYWMWGAEMGVNDAGVAIGNEAVFTRAPQQERGLLGMDLVRLGLERAASARAAVDIITTLLAEHGQGGQAGHLRRFRYHNSFLLADPDEAWVLETADRAWAASRVRGIRSISNGLTIRDDWELSSDGLAARARDDGLDPGKSRVDFARTFADRLTTWGAAARRRRACTETFLARLSGRIDARAAEAALRQHGAGEHPERIAGGLRMTVCAHASWWPTRQASQTTGSLAAELDGGGARCFVTATSAPCLSTFKPVWLDAGLPDLGPTPARTFDPAALWWAHERLHRLALADLSGTLRELAPERDRLEASWRGAGGTVAERRAVSQRAVDEGRALCERFVARLAAAAGRLPGPLYRRYWERLDRGSGLGA
jgi:dipeptidase